VLQVLSGLAVIGSLFLVRTQGAAPRRPEPQPAEPHDLDLRISLAETLVRHRLNVNRLLAQGQQPPVCFDAHEFIATQQRYHHHPRLRRLWQATMGSLLLVKLFVVVIVPGIFCYTHGVRDPLPWGILLAEGLVGLYLRFACSSATVIKILRTLPQESAGAATTGKESPPSEA
jgi:hypothetical protein